MVRKAPRRSRAPLRLRVSITPCTPAVASRAVRGAGFSARSFHTTTLIIPGFVFERDEDDAAGGAGPLPAGDEARRARGRRAAAISSSIAVNMRLLEPVAGAAAPADGGRASGRGWRNRRRGPRLRWGARAGSGSPAIGASSSRAAAARTPAHPQSALRRWPASERSAPAAASSVRSLRSSPARGLQVDRASEGSLLLAAAMSRSALLG